MNARRHVNLKTQCPIGSIGQYHELLYAENGFGFPGFLCHRPSLLVPFLSKGRGYSRKFRRQPRTCSTQSMVVRRNLLLLLLVRCQANHLFSTIVYCWRLSMVMDPPMYPPIHAFIGLMECRHTYDRCRRPCATTWNDLMNGSSSVLRTSILASSRWGALLLSPLSRLHLRLRDQTCVAG